MSAPTSMPILTMAAAPTNSHTRAEWESVRPHIERLYLGNNKPLRQVMQIMEHQHGFKAT